LKWKRLGLHRHRRIGIGSFLALWRGRSGDLGFVIQGNFEEDWDMLKTISYYWSFEINLLPCCKDRLVNYNFKPTYKGN
jgi:hypothetical protein